jgi:hypothetical protein
MVILGLQLLPAMEGIFIPYQLKFLVINRGSRPLFIWLQVFAKSELWAFLAGSAVTRPMFSSLETTTPEFVQHLATSSSRAFVNRFAKQFSFFCTSMTSYSS